MSTISYELSEATSSTSTALTSSSDSTSSSDVSSDSSDARDAFPTANAVARMQAGIVPDDFSARALLASSETLTTPAGPVFAPQNLTSTSEVTRKSLLKITVFKK